MNLADEMQAVKNEYNIGSGAIFKFEEGENVIRVLDLCVNPPIARHFLGKGVSSAACFGIEKGCPYHGERAPLDDDGAPKVPQVKFLAYILDKTGKVKLAEFPYTIANAITSYQNKTGYEFESFPMPYDLIIEYDKNAAPNQKYEILPARVSSDVSQEIIGELEAKKPLKQIVADWKEAAKAGR